MEDHKDEMTFWDHLDDLRWTLFRSLIALTVFAIISFVLMPYIYDNYIIGPTKPDFFLYKYLCKATSSIAFMPDFCDDSFHIKIININLASQFFRHMTTSFWLALILTFPYLVFEIWRFVRPALYINEKNSVRGILLFGTVMFFIGCFVGYSLVFPMTLRFLATYQLSESIENEISLDSYMDNFLMLIFIMGIVFELPLLSWFLSKLKLLDRTFFSKYRRHAIVGLLVLAAIITPSGDPFTLSVVFLPLYLLFELSRFMVSPSHKTVEDEDDTDNDSLIPETEE